jgi:GH24 family phage-related lysozyme (muramidase)
MNPAIALLLESLPVFEGNVPHFYLDARGNVTCGIGHLVAEPISAYEIEWQDTPSDLDINADFAAIQKSRPGHAPSYYRAIAKLTLADGWALRDCADRLARVYWPGLCDIFGAGQLATFPVPAQAALLDMCYNLGAYKLESFHRLIAACAGGIFACLLRVGAMRFPCCGVCAAAQCHRLGVQESRNAWTVARFVEAQAQKIVPAAQAQRPISHELQEPNQA